MNTRLANKLLEGTGLRLRDLARIALETAEAMGDEGKQKLDINRMREIMLAGVKAVKDAENTVTFEEAAWESIRARSSLRETTLRDLKYYIRRFLKVKGVAERPLRAMSTKECRELLQKVVGHSASSYVKGRSVLHSVFSFGIRREWCDVNPVSRIELPKTEEKPIVPLTLDEVERLQKTVQRPEFREMRLSLNLMLYGGIRPTEVSRLSVDDINWTDKQVIIRSKTSKTGGGRIIPLRRMSSLRKRDLTIPSNWKQRWKELRDAAGFQHWVPDICRHTFASYHAAYFRNLPALQLEMGHRDCSLLMSRYVCPTYRKTAAAFWHGTHQACLK